jgi:CheY-like chemotaxis protein
VILISSFLDILIVDDDLDYQQSLCWLVKRRGFTPHGFGWPSEAKEYLATCEQLPVAYFVDMRTPPELDGPEELYHLVKQLGGAERFYFNTGTVSPHDELVIANTGAKVLVKTDGRIHDILQELRKAYADLVAIPGASIPDS